ncbi:MAG: hypothetical protein V3V08_00655 [Nannocystaceae bacterium]
MASQLGPAPGEDNDDADGGGGGNDGAGSGDDGAEEDAGNDDGNDNGSGENGCGENGSGENGSGENGSGENGNDDDDDDDGSGNDDSDDGADETDGAKFDIGTPDISDNSGDLGNGCDKMDILFVIDNSISMYPRQQALIAAFPTFVETLNAYVNENGETVDYRIGVTTTAVGFTYTAPLGFDLTLDGDDGKLRTTNGQDSATCLTNGRPWVERNDADRDEAFACVAEVGTAGLPIEMPLMAVKMSLEERVEDGTNRDFIREDALLATVILTDEDDCSVNNSLIAPGWALAPCLGDNEPDNIMPVTDTLATLDAAKAGERGLWAAAVLANDADCSWGPGGIIPGDPAARLLSFADEAGSQAVYAPICEDDLAAALEIALASFVDTCDNVVSSQ